MKTFKGKKKVKNHGKQKISILDIDFENNYTIYVFEGDYSKNDIKLSYFKEGNKKLRTPTHVHWAVDLLLKLQVEKELTKDFIEEIKREWEKCKPLRNNDYNTLVNVVNNYIEVLDTNKYKTLSNYGEYDIDFLAILMGLLMVQEKTNNKDAFMFAKILDKLLKDKIDIFSILSIAGFRGNKR